MKPKLGAGARGGHVIGQTKGGHPIYASHHAKYANMHVRDSGDIGKDAKQLQGSFAHYSPADHDDAASAHFKEAYRADTASGMRTSEGAQHLRASLAHHRLSGTPVKKSFVQAVGHCVRCGKSMGEGDCDE